MSHVGLAVGTILVAREVRHRGNGSEAADPEQEQFGFAGLCAGQGLFAFDGAVDSLETAGQSTADQGI